MIRTGTLEAASGNRSKFTLANGTGYFKSTFLESPPDAVLGPQSFLVEQDANSVILSHFHLQNEFQVVVQGEGSFGRHPVKPITVHYAAAHTGYGPITAGPEGLWYFTLRPRMDFGAKFLPEARGEMLKLPKRHLLGGPVALSPAGSSRSEPSVEAVFPAQADGIGGWVLRIPANASVAVPGHPGGIGRFYVVVQGAARINDATLQRWATAFITPDEEPMSVSASESGADLLVLQFPQQGEAA